MEFPENSEDAVATFTAEDPERASRRLSGTCWSVDDATGTRLVYRHGPTTTLTPHTSMIDEDGDLTFSIGDDKDPPDYENPPWIPACHLNNTYKVVVVPPPTLAIDWFLTSYYEVTVKVTDVAETGEVSWTVKDPDVL